MGKFSSGWCRPFEAVNYTRGGGRSGARSGGVHSRVGSSGTIERDDDMIGPLTRIERKAKVAKYLEKRARMKKNRLEGKSHKYQGRTKFANARR